MSMSSISLSNGENSDVDLASSDLEEDIHDEILDVPLPPCLSSEEIGNHCEVIVNEEQDVLKMGYRICGDNVDKSIKHRYMRTDLKSNVKGFHYFQSYATKNKIDTTNLHSTCTCFPSPTNRHSLCCPQ